MLSIQQNMLEDALGVFKQLVALDPRNYDAYVKMGLIYVEKKEPEKALEAFTVAERGIPEDIRIKQYRGSTLIALERFDEALAAYRGILVLAPDDTDAILQIAYNYTKQDTTHDAIPLLQKAVAEQPGKPELYLYLAGAYLQLEKYQEAADVLNKGIQMAPDRDDLLFNLAVAYEKLGRREDLISALKRTIEINPDHAEALNYLGYTYAEKGEHLDEAVTLIKKALRVKPDSGYILDSLAWAYYQKGMYRDALKEMQKAVKQVPDDPIMLEHFGDIELKLSNKKKTREQWLKSLERDPTNRKLREKFKAAGFGDPDVLLKDVVPKKKDKNKK
jgi:tetratricopeptide (TPR) repeat protein